MKKAYRGLHRAWQLGRLPVRGNAAKPHDADEQHFVQRVFQSAPGSRFSHPTPILGQLPVPWHGPRHLDAVYAIATVAWQPA